MAFLVSLLVFPKCCSSKQFLLGGGFGKHAWLLGQIRIFLASCRFIPGYRLSLIHRRNRNDSAELAALLPLQKAKTALQALSDIPYRKAKLKFTKRCRWGPADLWQVFSLFLKKVGSSCRVSATRLGWDCTTHLGSYLCSNTEVLVGLKENLLMKYSLRRTF